MPETTKRKGNRILFTPLRVSYVAVHTGGGGGVFSARVLRKRLVFPVIIFPLYKTVAAT
jgi:hypothetical protein